MHSSGDGDEYGDYSPVLQDTPLRFADDILDDILDDGLLDFRCVPLTVPETLLEITLAGPGPEAIRLLETLQGRPMSADQELEVAAEWERQARWLSARQQAANVAFVGATAATSRDGRREQDSRTLELALAVDCNDTFLKAKLATARLLATTLTATATRLAAGELSDYRARRICEHLQGLPAQVAQQIEARVLPTAADLRLPSLLAKLRRLVLAAQGPDAAVEHLQGQANRRVTLDTEPPEPGLLGLHAYLPAHTAVAVRQALEAKAKEFARADRNTRQQTAEDGAEPARRRTRDQRLADALAWYVLGPDEHDPSTPQQPKILVQLTMSLTTLLHLRDNAAELPGYGPIPADIARILAQDADWQRFIHHPVTGYLLDVGDTLYRPPPPMRRFTQARDVKDRFPGANRSAYLADSDHVQPFAPGTGGHTASTNLASLSRIGHIAKTHGGWTCHGDANNTLTWTSPHGHTYRSTPHDYSDEPEPEPPY
jgi:hypothetical protein